MEIKAQLTVVEQAFKDLQASQKPVSEANTTPAIFKAIMQALARGRTMFELIDQGLQKRSEEEQGSVSLGKRQRTEE